MWLLRSSFEDLLSDFLLHHDRHLFRWIRDIVEEVEEDRTRYIVGDIRDDAICLVSRSEGEDILMMDGYRGRLDEDLLFSDDLRGDLFAHIALIEDLDHIGIELDEIKGRWMMREDIVSQSAISWSDLDNMLSGDSDRVGDIGEGFLIDEEVLSEGFFGFDSFIHNFIELS